MAGLSPRLRITAPTGATLTASLAGDTVSLNEVASGVYEADVGKLGPWVVSGSMSGAEATATVDVADVGRFTGEIKFLPTASITPKSGVTYTQNALASLDDEKINAYAEAISNNADITNETNIVYIDDGATHIELAIGDQISYTMDGTSYPFRIMGFNHYALTTATAYGSSTATGKAGILFQMVDCWNEKMAMKSSMTSSDGWGNSDLRTWMNSTMIGYLPSATQNVIKYVTLSTATSVSSATIVTSNERFFLPAEVEVFGTTSYAKGGTNEGTRYAWYKANDTVANRVKKVNGSANFWWERSPYNWYSDYSYSRFCCVTDDGNTNYGNANSSRGVVPCFCI